jgi:hypothetical protein
MVAAPSRRAKTGGYYPVGGAEVGRSDVPGGRQNVSKALIFLQIDAPGVFRKPIGRDRRAVARSLPVAMGADEDDLLESSSDRDVTSRLSCQIAMTDDLEGFRVTVAHES